MSGTERGPGRQRGLGLSSEHDEGKVQEVDSRSEHPAAVRRQAKRPKATWSEDPPPEHAPPEGAAPEDVPTRGGKDGTSPD